MNQKFHLQIPQRNPSRCAELSRWEDFRISIPVIESDDVHYSNNSPKSKKVLSLRQKHQENLSGINFDKQRKINSLVDCSAFFETNRRTLLTKRSFSSLRRLIRGSDKRKKVPSKIKSEDPDLEIISYKPSANPLGRSTRSPTLRTLMPAKPRRIVTFKKSSQGTKASDSLAANRAEQIARINPMVRLSRRETFSASHRLHNPKLSDQQNAQIYDKCNHLHGHNYVVYVILQGPIDEQTGMVYNIADLKQELGKVLDTLDHKNLDKDVEFFESHVSTVENIAFYIASTLKLSKPELLHKIKVCETEKNTASVYLNNN